jgi:putative ABC transport system substrate-binding protein
MFAIAPYELVRLAAQYRLPTISGPGLPTIGGLLGYGDDITARIRGTATYVDRLLRGAKVSDLPVQYPTKFRCRSISKPEVRGRQC